MIGRSLNVATPAERGRDCLPDPLDGDREGDGVAPKDRRHDLETLTDHDGPPVERCRFCERVAHPGRIDPFGVCPARARDDRAGDVDDEPEPKTPRRSLATDVSRRRATAPTLRVPPRLPD